MRFQILLNQGFNFLSLVAVISTGIGIVNLLPIPILDGGHIILLIYEYFLQKNQRICFKIFYDIWASFVTISTYVHYD